MYLVLPGFSLKNKEEADAIASALARLNKPVHLHKWRHWEADVEWNAQEEINILKQSITEPVTIIAKSIGTYVAAALLTQYKPEKLILMGIPINDLTPEELNVYYNLGKIDTCTVIQNLYDPHGSATQVDALLNGINHKLITKQASDHSYFYIDDILSILELK